MTYMGTNCGGDGAVANLVAPPIDGSFDTGTGDGAGDRPADATTGMDTTGDLGGSGDGARDMMMDLPIANLVAPPVEKIR